MEPEIFEMLIGKYIDGEITDKEHQMLDEELERDFEAREFIKQLQELDKYSREAVGSEIFQNSREASDIFERAWQRRRHPVFRFLKPASGWFSFAAGLAAGLLIGIGLHFAFSTKAVPPTGTRQQIATQGSKVPGDTQATSITNLPNTSATKETRNIDWFSFTDKDGDEWIVEGLRKDILRPASYSKEL
jgi:anti-sigma factor RsiW